jgi:hypothetical protein
MDEAILERLFKLYKIDDIPEDIMPMTISLPFRCVVAE